MTGGRGSNYFIESKSDVNNTKSKCLTTVWNLSHLFLYAIIGYIYPDPVSLVSWFSVGVSFEIWEKYAYNCEDPLDVVYNGLGLIIGSYYKSLR